jgi:hypothetical protein
MLTSPDGPSRRRLILRVGTALLATLTAGELGARLLTRDIHGGPHLFGVRLLPLPRLPAGHREVLERSEASDSYLMADPQLGWVPRPLAQGGGGLYRTDAHGFRISGDPAGSWPPVGARAVLLLGDSFTHGDEVEARDTSAARLATELGPGYAVANAGVPGYGMDQALLRFERLAEEAPPEVAVLAFCRDDLLRNLNVFRSLYHHWTDLPWSKPRFVLEGPGLRLLNVPTLPGEEVIAILESRRGSPLLDHDRCFWPGLFEHRWIRVLRLGQVLDSKREHRARYEHLQALVREGGEGILVGARILARFSDGARSRGTRPILLALPEPGDLGAYRSGLAPRLAPLFEECERLGLRIVDVAPELVAALGTGEEPAVHFVRGVGHPNGRMNAIVARCLAREILKG